MATYTIAAIESGPREFSGKHGPMRSWKLTLTGSEGTDLKDVELVQKPSTDPPAVGGSLEGAVETKTMQRRDGSGEFTVKKFTKEQQFGGGGGAYKQTHPVDAARMGRSHAQDMALSYMAIKAQLGKVDDFKPSDLWELINWFDEDVKRSSQTYGQPLESRKDSEPTGVSDVPSGPSEAFSHRDPGPGSDVPFGDAA